MFAYLLLSAGMQAQTVSDSCKYILTGKVKDEHSKETLPFANLFIRGTKLATVSDSSGNFSFKGLCAGTYFLISAHVDCDTVTVEFVLSDNMEIVILQEHHARELRELIIEAQRNPVQQSSSISILGTREMNSNQGKALGEMLKNIPGVSSIQTGNNISKPVIHGLHSNRIIILNNGVRQEGQQWGSEHAPEIDPFVADKISVIKGASGVRYGSDAMGGVILIEPGALRDSAGYDAVVNLAGAGNGRHVTANAIVNGNIKQLKGLNFRLQGTLKKAGNSKAPDYYLKNTGFTENNFSTALAFHKARYGSEVFHSRFNSKIGILSAAHIGNNRDLERAFKSKVPLDSAGFSYEIQRPLQHIVHDLFKWKSYLNLNRAGKIIYTISRQTDKRSEYDKHGPRNDSLSLLNKPELQFNINTLIHDVYYEIQMLKRLTMQAGFTTMHQANSYDGRFFIPNFNNTCRSVYVIENYKNKRFFAEAGIRYDAKKLRVFIDKNGFIKQPIYSYNNYAAMVGAGYFFKVHQLKANLGTGWRAPSANELYANGVHHGAAAVEIGNQHLLPESNVNASLWWSIKSIKNFSCEIEIYKNHIRNFIYLIPVQPATQTIRGAFPTYKYMQVNAGMSGLDANINFKITKAISTSISGNYLYAIDMDNKNRLTQMPQNSIESGIVWEPVIKNSKWSALYVHISNTIVMKARTIVGDEDYLAPPAGYHLLNAKAGIDLKIKNQKMHIGISISNALNSSYRNYLNRYRYFADDTGTNVGIQLKIPVNFKPILNEKK